MPTSSTWKSAVKRLIYPAAGDAKLGSFLGVFTPSILTILGVILFLRIGWMVGNTGLFPSLVIVSIANAITLATALSVSAVATNMYVGAGGAYYILSRSLGLEIGGAIGIPLFLAQTFSVTLYAFGFAESLQFVWPDAPVQPIAAITVLAVSLISGRSANLALRLQIPILILLVLAIASLFTGVVGEPGFKAGLWQGVENAPGFWVVFAVFFPAVTGIMAGVSLSGDLKNPTRSIPRGTLAAVLVGFIVYLTVPVVLALGADSATLVGDPLVWMTISAIPLLVLPGLWGAILSSAVGSMLGAPRTLEALVDDEVMPQALHTEKERPGPGRAHIISTLAALVGVGLGDLNAVAPVLTMFFLTTYGMINLVAGLERLSGAPSFRPMVRIPSWISLFGAIGCFWVMFLINSLACIVAIVAEIVIYLVLRRRSLTASWGDLRFGVLMSLARATLLQLRNLPVAPRNWRPHILVFAGDIDRRVDLVRFAAWLNQDRGIMTVSRLFVGDYAEHLRQIPAEEQRIQRRLEREGIIAFSEVEVVPDFEQGVVAVSQANGIAGISSNTIMFGWSEKRERMASTLRVMGVIGQMGKSTLICRVRPRAWNSRARRIDVWWGGLQNNGDKMLLFAYLLSVNPEWHGAEICVRSVATNEMMQQQTRRSLERMLQESRITARTEVTIRREGVSIQDMIHEQSRDADIVFLGLRQPEPGAEMAYAERLEELVGTLPTVVLVRNASQFAGKLL
jgi:amino acid transporter